VASKLREHVTIEQHEHNHQQTQTQLERIIAQNGERSMHNEARIDAMLQQQDAAIKQHAESHLEHAAKTEEMYSPGRLRLLTPSIGISYIILSAFLPS
jgi:hypothetical protein